MIPAYAAKQAPQAAKSVLLLTPVLLGRPAAARVLGVSLSTLDNLVGSGDLPSVWVGGRRMLRPGDLAAWADSLPAAPARGAT